MNTVVIGCGRVGSSVAKGLAAEGWDVTVVDEDEDALARLGAAWRGGFVVGHGMDVSVLERAGAPKPTQRSSPRTGTTPTSSSDRC